jgi:hypothetical protein
MLRSTTNIAKCEKSGLSYVRPEDRSESDSAKYMALIRFKYGVPLHLFSLTKSEAVSKATYIVDDAYRSVRSNSVLRTLGAIVR